VQDITDMHMGNIWLWPSFHVLLQWRESYDCSLMNVKYMVCKSTYYQLDVDILSSILVVIQIIYLDKRFD
jgi:hypothetical protein